MQKGLNVSRETNETGPCFSEEFYNKIKGSYIHDVIMTELKNSHSTFKVIERLTNILIEKDRTIDDLRLNNYGQGY